MDGPTGPFTNESTHECPLCKIIVNIGSGGVGNWKQHLEGNAHKKKLRESLSHKSISSFFSKSTSIPAPKFSSPLPPPTLSDTGPSSSNHHLDDDLPDFGHSSPMLTRLFEAISKLPQSVPLATSSDTLARFSNNPVAVIEDGVDVWETLDKALNPVVGYGIPAEDLAKLIRRGDQGMDGLFRWIHECVTTLQINEALLEGKVDKIIEAIGLICKAPPSVPDPSKSALPAQNSCPGYRLCLEGDRSVYSVYHFFLHDTKSLPWTISTTKSNTELMLRSHHCTDSTRGNSPCENCRRLEYDNLVTGIRHRAAIGPLEKTPWAYLGPGHMYDTLNKKTEEINRLKLKGLGFVKTIAIRNRHIAAWKRLSIAISEENIPRLRSLFSEAHRAGSSVFTIIETVKKAAERKYTPKGYDQADYELGYLLLKLGGHVVANISHRALGTVSPETAKRRLAALPIIASAAFPLLSEFKSNLSACYPGLSIRLDFEASEPQNTTIHRRRIRGMSIEIDEIKLQERLRWLAVPNLILGVCREHSEPYPLEFRSMHQADHLLAGLKAGNVHLATEATVLGASILSGNPNEYSTRAFGISGSCKRETVANQERLLRLGIQAVNETVKQSEQVRLYCVATDGDSRRRRALMAITLIRALNQSDPIFDILGAMPLFNLWCGDGCLTMDFDWKHVFKRFRNTLLRLLGVTIDGISISADVIKAHLIKNGMPTSEAESLLAPNDKQDVILMLKLLYSISFLPLTVESNNPLTKSTRRVLWLLGRIYFNLLTAYLDVSLSLNEQLTRLSAAAHLVLAIYHRDKGGFIPVQTCFDVMSMIKNVYFCVAKTQKDDPHGSFWIILLGTDGLEKVFGKVRTMVGNDTNADQFQLANRIDGAVQCVKILEEHPEWGGQARRLKIRPLSNNTSNISSAYDHINPKAWTGDVSVANVVLRGCWSAGRQKANEALSTAEISSPSPFDDMEKEGGYDILCPFGQSKMMLLNGQLESGESDETEEDCDAPIIPLETPANTPLFNEPLDPDVDDIAAEENIDSGAIQDKSAPYIDIEGKKVHKASILRLYSNPLAVSGSKDRLKRIRGYSRYNESPEALALIQGQQASHPAQGTSTVELQDPAVTLVRCNKQVFLAVIEILEMRDEHSHHQTLSTSRIHEPNIRIQAQVLKLSLRDISHQPDGADWEWIGSFEHQAKLHNVEGNLIELIDPDLVRASRGRNKGTDTYVFRTSELRILAADLFSRVDDRSHLPEIIQSNTFPYRSAQGHACFACETDGRPDGDVDLDTCLLCRKVKISELTGPALVSHMSAHILHDVRLRDANMPCGFCLNTDGLCHIQLIHSTKISRIDIKSSRCPNLRKISLKAASKFSKRSPCSNHPLTCPLCAKVAWKYNFRQHLISVHPSANIDLYEDLFKIQKDEVTLMKALFQSGPSRTSRKKKARIEPIPISEGHSSRLALQDDNTNENILPEASESEESEDDDELASDLDESVDNAPTEDGLDKEAPVDIDEPDRCAELGCDEVILDPSDLLTCDAPGCVMKYHMSCMGVVERPKGGWFCDDECKKNAGLRVSTGRKRKRGGKGTEQG